MLRRSGDALFAAQVSDLARTFTDFIPSWRCPGLLDLPGSRQTSEPDASSRHDPFNLVKPMLRCGRIVGLIDGELAVAVCKIERASNPAGALCSFLWPPQCPKPA